MGKITLSADAVDMKDVLKRLDNIGNLQRATGPALRAGAKIVLAAAKQTAPVRSGDLKKKLRIGRRLKTKDTSAIEVGSFGGDRVGYAHLVEHGHRGPHPAPAHPFLQPAVDSSAEAAAQAIMEELKKHL